MEVIESAHTCQFIEIIFVALLFPLLQEEDSGIVSPSHEREKSPTKVVGLSPSPFRIKLLMSTGYVCQLPDAVNGQVKFMDGTGSATSECSVCGRYCLLSAGGGGGESFNLSDELALFAPGLTKW